MEDILLDVEEAQALNILEDAEAIQAGLVYDRDSLSAQVLRQLLN